MNVKYGKVSENVEKFEKQGNSNWKIEIREIRRIKVSVLINHQQDLEKIVI